MYLYRQPTKVKGLPIGSRGVLVSCVVGKENLAGQEAVHVLTEAYEALAEKSKDGETAEETIDGNSKRKAGDDVANSTDIGAALAAEIDDLKDSEKKDFYYTKIGCPALVYVDIRYKDGPLPSDLVEHACREAKRTRQNQTRLCHRFYPLDRICPSNVEDMQKMADEISKEHFPEDATSDGITFSVDYEKRAQPSELTRDVVIDMFAKSVKTPPNKVNLTNPEKTILVNVMKDSCGVSVAKNYRELAKFNLTALAVEEEK